MTSRNLYTEQHNAVNNVKSRIMRTLFLAGMMLFGVQAIAQPIFNNGGAQTYTLCANAGGTDITSLLTAHDNTGAANFTWTLTVPPTHGSIANLPYGPTALVGVSTNTTPVGVTYTPNTGYIGSETIQVTVTDGFGSTTTNITFTNMAYPLPITVPSTVCANGATITVTDGTSGGTYSPANIFFSFTGGTSGITTVTGVSAGTSNITYTLPNTCFAYAQVTVAAAPTSITGSPTVCTGASAPYPTGLTSSGGTTWSTSNAFVATVNGTGVVTGVSNGTVTISYTLASTGCFSTFPMTVFSTPLPITGPAIVPAFTVCTGLSIPVASGTTGGIFSSSDGSLATVSATGAPGSGTANVNGILAGIPTITYTVPSGCAVYQPVTVNTTPNAIAGASSVCMTYSTVLTDLTAGGTWSSSNALLGSVIASGAGAGTVTGIAAGAPYITYTASNGCYATQAFNVYANPAAISGSPFTVCTGMTNTATDATAGGTWSSSNTGLATVVAGPSTSTTVSGVSIGVPNISYTITATGCYAIQSYTVNQTPVATTGASTLCVSATTTLTNTTGGGTWSTSDPLKATVVSGTGVVTGVGAGAVTISYVLPSGCYALWPMTINNNPAAIGGPTTVCVGSAISATDASTPGTWTSSNTSQASIVSGTGLITGLSAGTPTITFTNTATGCFATESIVVNTTPGAISGTTGICVGGNTTLASSPAGGSWTSSAPAVATITALGGLVNGLTAGTTNITYTLGSGCFSAATVTVNPLPSAISGASQVCVGSTIVLTDGGGGVWTSSNPSWATVGAGTGIVAGVAPGSPTITYTLPTGCAVTQVVAVNANPLPITGTTNVCGTGTSLLSDGSAGPATWSSSNTAIVTVSAGGLVTGVSAGTANISYTVTATGCSATTSFVDNANPGAITGTLAVCTGATTTLSNATGGGTWSTSDPTKATVNAATGVVTGVATGSATISYILGTGCYAVATVVVNQTPVAITGTQNVCVGLTTALSDATPGPATWTSSNTSLATVAGNIVTGVAAGVPNITYAIVATGCYTVTPVTVNPNPAVPGGTLAVCVGSTTVLTEATSGGTWSSSDVTKATVGATTGIVTGVLAGSPNIIYTLPTGCLNQATVVVNPLPAAISGTFNVCTGFTTTLTDATAGPATWSSSNGTMATVTAGGVVSGLAAGVPTITYQINATGCYTTQPVTVNQTPPAPTPAGSSICVGATTTLTDATTGGIWSSSNPAFATVGAGTGTVTGVSNGTATIIYTVPSGCSNSTTIIVNPNPAAITGTTNVCIGLTTTLADATTPAGTWTSSNSSEATTTGGAGTSNVILGISAGTPIITYTLPTGCFTTTPVTVNPNPAAISGAASVCTGYTTTFSTITTGGTWSSSNAAQGTVGAATGIVGGITPGSPTITYTLPTGCLATKSIVVNQTPVAIAGPTNVCVGFNITLTDATSTGNWTSSNASLAAVVIGPSASTVLTGIASGIPLITYTIPATGCYVTTPITVNPNPAAITGATSVCTGQTIGLADITSGGTWSSSDATKATIGAGTGVVTGVAVGSPTMSYTLATGCYATYGVAVNQTPSAITGVATVCTGFTTTLASATLAGTWSSSNTSEASVVAGPSASTVVTGVGAGTPIISYTLGSCYVTQAVVVNPNPPASTGTASVCVGATTVLSNTLAGGTWSSTNPAMATVGAGTGIVSGIAVGTPNISYTMPTGCYVITPVVVNPTPSAITGPTVVCAGSNITLNDATSGGVWSSGNTATATIAPGTGIVTGVAAGVVNMTYTLGAGCTASYTITVNPVPNISSFTSTVATSLCVGVGSVVTIASSSLGAGTFTVTYNLSGANAVTGATATLTMGATTGTFNIPLGSLIATGSTTVTITGISNALTCTSVPLSNNTSTFTVYPLPTVYTVTGGGGYCVGGTGSHVFLSNSTGGINYQLWLGATTVGTPLAGTFAGLDFGAITTVGTYTVTATNATTGCGSNMSGSATIFTNPLPTNTFTVTGGGPYCAGGSGVAVGLSSSQTGVSYQLYVSGVSTGSPVVGSGAAITFGSQTTAGVYTVIGTNTTTLCQSTMSGSQTVVINPLPASITGTMFLCPGTTTTLANTSTGGTWTTSTPGVATVGASTGVVTGVAFGTANIIYTLPTGCSISATVTVNPNPAAISGLTTVCAGSAITLADATGGGNWSSSNALIATVGVSSGIVNGIAAGTPTITYTLTTGCFATFNITVNPTPVAITGPASVCVGLTITAIDLTAGGVWTSSTPTVATIGGGTGIVTGVLAGITNLTYTLPAGCNVTESFTVNPTPAAVTGTATVCVGLTTTLADATTGGTWTSSNTAIATISAGGVVTGVAAGTVSITYTLPAGCFTTYTVTVNPVAAAITGTNNVCVGLTTTLANTVTGGTWTSSNTAVATVGAGTGTVTGVAFGSCNITYTLPAGCFVIFPFTVNPLPAAITGTASVCVLLTTSLTDATTGGTWSSSNATLGSVVALTGVVTGVAAGNPVITYTLPTGCLTTYPITVNPIPPAITGIATVCAGATTTLFDATAGGTWTSSNTAVATVGTGTGIVGGVTAGTATITYTLPTTCLITAGTTVYPSPAAISGSNTVCVGLTTTLTDGVSGGSWSSSNTSLATISGLGVVAGVAVGTPTITYTLPAPGSCFTTMVETVNPQPVAITGVFTVCTGLSTTLNDATTGGSYTSSNTAIATVVSATGVVTGVSAGTVTITYTLPAGCFVTQTVTVYPTPAVITGNPTVCLGLTTALADGTSGGTWTSSLPAVGSISTTGVVSGITPGTTVISYTLAPIGCNVVYPVTVNPLPAAITGTLNVCVGSSTTLSDASAGGSWNSSNTAIATIGGFTGIMSGVAAGTVSLTYTLPTGCIATTSGTVNALPNIYTLTGGGAYCAGSTGVAVGLSGSDVGISYQLMNGGTAVGSPVAGTGSPISFGIQTTATTYTAVATNTTTGCTQAMGGSATVALSVLPTAFNMTGGGAYCAGGTGFAVGLSSSQPVSGGTSYSYQLYLNGTLLPGALVTGTGGAISFGTMTAGGNYTVVATNNTTGCVNNMTGVSVILVNPLPTAYTVTGGGINCPGSTGVPVGLSNSQTGVNYTLVGGTSVTLPGTTGSALSYGLLTTNATYTITALNATTGCSNTMLGSAAVTAGVAPTVFTLGFTGTSSAYCAGGTGVPLTLSGSQTLTSYQILLGGSNFGTAFTGTGALLPLGSVLAAGTYTVRATNTVTGCTSVTGTSVTVTINPLPPVTHITTGSGGVVCGIGGTGVAIAVDTTYSGYNYKLFNGATLQSTIAGLATVPSTITFPLQNTAGTYTVTATNTTTNCVSNMIGSATVSVALLPTQYTLAPTTVSTYCLGGTGVTLTLNNSDAGIRYQLYNTTTSLAIGTPVNGTGAPLVFGPLTAGNYNVVATNIATLCTNPMVPAFVTVTTNPLPTAYTVSSGGSYCAGGTGVDITISNSQAGVSYQLYNLGVSTGSAVLGTGTGSSLDMGIQASTGTYTVIGTNIVTGCTNTMTGAATVSITTAPAVFTVTGGGNYCAGLAGVPVGLSGSVTGVNYQLLDPNDGTLIGAAVAGTGGVISFGTISVGLSDTFIARATSTATGCTATMTGSAIINKLLAPALYTVTGGGGYCTGTSGTSVGLSSSDTGVSYQLYLAGISTGLPSVTGTGSAISFGLQTGTGIYTVVATRTSSGCTSTMTGSVLISINPLPSIHTVTGGGAYCPGGTGRVIGVDTGSTGINYQLYLSGAPVGSSVAGTTGVPVTFGLQTGIGTYTVKAVNPTTTCSSNMTGTAVVSNYALPTAFTITGGGGYCTGGTGSDVQLSGSVSGVNYQLYVGASTSGLPMSGTGSPLDFGNKTALGTYTVIATSMLTGCSNNMTSSVTVSLNPLPTAYNVTGGGSYCAGGAGLPVGLSNSDLTISYQLYLGSVMTGPALAGTGSALSFGTFTGGGAYTVIGTNSVTGCINSMSGSQSISVNALPLVYNVGGGGSFCAGGAGVPVTLSSSDAGINYQLKLGGSPVGAPFGGVTGLLNFGNQTAPGTYTVVATNSVTSCTSTMAGSTSVSVNPLPASTYVVTGGGSYCAGGTGLNVGLSGSASGISYQLYKDGIATGLPQAGGAGAINFGLQSAAGTYTVTGTNTTTLCQSNMTGSVSIIVNPLPIVDTVTGGGNYCPGGLGQHIGLSNSTMGINYQLYRGILPLGAPTAGTGTGLDFGYQSVVGTYFVTATDASTGCSINMVGSPSIGISPLPTSYNVIASSTGYCLGGSGVNISLNGSDVGTQYQLYLGAVPVGGSVSGTGFTINYGLQTSAGTYKVVATSIATTCYSTMNDTPSVVINSLPALYTVSGGGGFCAGGAGVPVFQSGSDAGVNYQLWRGSSSVATMAGTGYSLNFGPQTTGGTFTVVATNSSTGCTNNMLSSASVAVNPLPTAYTVVGGGSFCAGSAGSHVGISAMDSPCFYQLYLDGVAVGTTHSYSSSLDFGPQTTPGTYTILATNPVTSCSAPMTGSVTVSVNALPAAFTVTGGGNYCTGGTGVNVGLSGTASGITYQLKLGTVNVLAPVSGSGSSINFGLVTAAGTYTVSASNTATGCTNAMAGSVVVSISSLPSVYAVTGGGAYCASTAGLPVGLSGSDAGVNYQLYNGTSLIPGSVAGTGAAISFGLHTAGTYSVMAVNSTTTCSSNMTGTAVVTTMPSVIPSVTVATGVGDTVCTGTTVTFSALTVNGGAFPAFSWSVNGILTGATGSSYTFVPSNGNVISVMMTSNEPCPLPATANGSVTMTVRPDVTPSVTIAASPSTTVCQGTTVDITATPVNGGTTPSYSWKLGGVPVGSGNTFTYIPTDGDILFCTMTSSYQCVTASTVLSNNLTFNTQTSLAPVVTISLNSGANVGTVLYNDTLTATVTNPGAAPVYRWSINGVELTGASTSVLYSTTLNDQDVVACQVSDSNACGYLIGGSSFTVHSSNVSVKPVSTMTGDIRLVPNPNNGTFTIKGTLSSIDDQEISIEVTNVLGQVIYTSKVIAHNGVIDEKVQMNSGLANGMYMVNVQSATESKVFHMVVEQ